MRSFGIDLSKTRLIRSMTDPAAQQVVEIKRGQYSGVLLHFYGTNGAGLTRTVANNGDWELNLNRKGKQSIPMGRPSWEKLYDVNLACNGLARADSAAGGAFEFMVVIPFNHPWRNDPNAIHVFGDDVLELWVPDLDTPMNFTTAVIDVYGVISEAPMNYVPVFVESQYTLGGELIEELPVRNCQFLHMKLAAGATEPDAIGLRKRGEDFEDPKSNWDMLTAKTDSKYRIEAATLGVVLTDFTPNGDIKESVGLTQLLAAGGTGALEYLAFGRLPSTLAVLRETSDRNVTAVEHLTQLESMARANPTASDIG